MHECKNKISWLGCYKCVITMGYRLIQSNWWEYFTRIEKLVSACVGV